MRNFFMKQDYFYPLSSWPKYIQDIALKEHRTNRERFTFFFFLVVNGLMPETASEWVLSYDYRFGALVEGAYDSQAIIQVRNQLPKDTQSGKLFQGKKLILDMYDLKVRRW